MAQFPGLQSVLVQQGYSVPLSVCRHTFSPVDTPLLWLWPSEVCMEIFPWSSQEG